MPATHPLTSVPILNSLVGAAVSVYLDFVGHFDAVWGSYQNISTPVYNTDGDASTFSDDELTSMFNIWQGVSEDYAPFNVNVTTVAPPNFNNGSAVLVAIGGNGSWLGDLAGGVAYVDSFTNSLSNTVFVFPDNLGNGYAKYVADAASHESGHAFGLQHQSQWSGSTKVAEYYAGPGNGTAPLMGDSYLAARSLWWNGTSSISQNTIQDDMGVISRAANGFGYRADDYGNTAATASQLSVASNQFSTSGIITAITDADYFSFETGSGQISLSVDVGAYTNLDARLELRTDTGVLIASANPSNSFGATITTTVGAGIYRLVVASGGGYGNVGQYTVSGTLQSPSTAVIAPINLTSNTTGGQANLSWVDKAYNENSYFVDRSDDGLSWNNVATLGANATSWSDSNVTAGATYYYRVWAAGDVENSGYSNIRTVTMPPSIPTGLAANAVSSSILNLTWNDVSGETGFLIQRSTSGSSTWTQIATVCAGVTSYQNTGLKANTSYAYRVIATNAGGASAFSSVANGTTLPIPPAPLAGSGLAAHAVSTSQVDLSWTDNASNESGYIVQRATGSGTFKQIAALGADATTFSDTTATANKTFKYRVRAFNDGGNSAYSNTGSATTPVVIAPSR